MVGDEPVARAVETGEPVYGASPPPLILLADILLTPSSCRAGSFFGQSAFARHAVVSESSVVKVPPGTDLVQLAPLGCGLQSGCVLLERPSSSCDASVRPSSKHGLTLSDFPCRAGVLLNQLKPSQDDSVVIFGLGAVGFGACVLSLRPRAPRGVGQTRPDAFAPSPRRLWAAAHLQLRTIIVVDLVSTRLDLARTQGATHAFSGASPTLLADIRAATGGIGAWCAIEATGVERVLKSAWDAVCNFGHVVSVGNPGPGVKAPFECVVLLSLSSSSPAPRRAYEDSN